MLTGKMEHREFQSTPSVGRATVFANTAPIVRAISIHALRGEGDDITARLRCTMQTISIHALRGEGDDGGCCASAIWKHFNPRPPWGGRPLLLLFFSCRAIFQSTPSVGRATGHGVPVFSPQKFQSTPSVGRATAKTYKYATLCLYIVHIKLYIFATAVLFT